MAYVTSVKDWRDAVSPDQERKFLDLLGGQSLRASFAQLAMPAGNRSARKPSALRALQIEAATRRLNREDASVPVLACGSIAEACGQCPHWLATEAGRLLSEAADEL